MVFTNCKKKPKITWFETFGVFNFTGIKLSLQTAKRKKNHKYLV
ncbi:hypothetical protein Nmel_009431 [Mimus melanotis]